MSQQTPQTKPSTPIGEMLETGVRHIDDSHEARIAGLLNR